MIFSLYKIIEELKTRETVRLEEKAS